MAPTWALRKSEDLRQKMSCNKAPAIALKFEGGPQLFVGVVGRSLSPSFSHWTSSSASPSSVDLLLCSPWPGASLAGVTLLACASLAAAGAKDHHVRWLPRSKLAYKSAHRGRGGRIRAWPMHHLRPDACHPPPPMLARSKSTTFAWHPPPASWMARSSVVPLSGEPFFSTSLAFPLSCRHRAI